MKIEIKLIAGKAGGKTHLAKQLRQFLENECHPRAEVVIHGYHPETHQVKFEQYFLCGGAPGSKVSPEYDVQYFQDGEPKPYLSWEDYHELRDDDRFLHNCKPKDAIPVHPKSRAKLPKSRYWLHNGNLYCRHSVILHGNACHTCGEA